MKIKTAELTSPALDWAVAKCIVGSEMSRLRVRNGRPDLLKDGGEPRGYRLPTDYSTNWAQGGPIIEREKITIAHNFDASRWEADMITDDGGDFHNGFGPTPLIAAMRCYVASKLGDEVDIPKELK